MKAIIFDFDGTILDTEHTELTAWQYIYSNYNSILPVEQWLRRVHITPQNFDPMLHLEKTLGRPLDRDQVTKHRREKLAELVIDLKPLPGIEDWILTAHALGLKLAVASSSPRYWVVGHLERTNLLTYFDLIITKEDVKASKPNPEAYQMVLDHFQIKADEALAIEDSPVGASAAVSAGLRCIIVPNKLTKGLTFPLTFRTVSNLVELSLHKTIEELTPNPFVLVKHIF